MNISIEWLEPWDSLCTDGKSFEDELYKELGKDHILYEKQISAIGRRYDRDEYLFQVNNSKFELAIVHLTFSGKRENNPYPRTKVYKDISDWINNCMIPDNHEFND